MEPYGNLDPGLGQWIDLYFDLLPLFLESSFKFLDQYDIGGQLPLIMSHLLSDSRLLCITSLVRKIVPAIVEFFLALSI